jgi:RNase H-fold protein (predicted Holliday junction resolvase)
VPFFRLHQPLFLIITSFSLTMSLIVNEKANAQIDSSQLNLYPDVVLDSLWQNCIEEAQRFNLVVPLDLKSSTSIRSVSEKKISELSKKVAERKKSILNQSIESERLVDSQVEERLAQLSELLRDKVKFNQQIDQLKAAIIFPDLPKEQLPQLEKLLKDLEDIKKDPSMLKVKSDESKRKALQDIQAQKEKALGEIDQEFTRYNYRYTSCACKIESLQKKHTVQTFYKQLLKEINGEPAISKDWTEFSQMCKK